MADNPTLYVLMMVRNWSDLRLSSPYEHIDIDGMRTNIPGGGRVPITAFLPVFSTYEHAEAARGDNDHISIHPITPTEDSE